MKEPREKKDEDELSELEEREIFQQHVIISEKYNQQEGIRGKIKTFSISGWDQEGNELYN